MKKTNDHAEPTKVETLKNVYYFYMDGGSEKKLEHYFSTYINHVKRNAENSNLYVTFKVEKENTSHLMTTSVVRPTGS